MAYITAATRAIIVWNVILGHPFVAAFTKTDGSSLPAQTIRLEYEKAVSGGESMAGRASARRLDLFGVRNHPTAPDTDMRKGYTFVYQKREYTLLDPIIVEGEIQVKAEAVS